MNYFQQAAGIVREGFRAQFHEVGGRWRGHGSDPASCALCGEIADAALDALQEAGYVLVPVDTSKPVRFAYRITYTNRARRRVIWAQCDTEEMAKSSLADAVKDGRWADARIEDRPTTTLADGRELVGLWDPPWET